MDQELKNETEQDFDHFIKVLLANQEAPISIIDAGTIGIKIYTMKYAKWQIISSL